MSVNPKISVVVPTYNRYKDLEKLIQSFMLQRCKNAELLILDDLGAKETEKLVKAYQKKDRRIVYHKNKKNLGFSRNIMQSFALTRSDYVVFMGDDDLFIHDDALSYFAQAFSQKNVGVVKAQQIIFKGSHINQASPILLTDKEIQVYKNGTETFENLWFESLSISGLGFINNSFVRDSITSSVTLYPQVELMGRVCLKYGSAAINHYLVAVKSHAGQLNCMVYELDSVRTNMLSDWLNIYDRIREKDKNNALQNFNQQRFLQKFTSFMTVFFPYTRLSRGRLDTIRVCVASLLKYPLNCISPRFLISVFASVILPKPILEILIEKVKRTRLVSLLKEKEVSQFNTILSLYYK